MKKMNKLAAAVAVALSLGVAPNVNATIELKPNGVGDALIFPVFIGYSNFENYFTISNNHDQWVAGHIRFRGAAWSGEILDFPVILSPGDVFVFRLADLDGSNNWAIDQSLDPKNFAYTNQLCENEILKPDSSYILIPKIVNVAAASGQTAQQASDAVINHQQRAGYIEFFGTAVLDGMTENRMIGLLNNDNQLWQNTTPNACNKMSKRGTSVWAWSDSAHLSARKPDGLMAGVLDQGLSDVPNVLSGNGFISAIGSNTSNTPAIAYNAEAIVNFRTPTRGTNVVTGALPEYAVGSHRIENYHRNFQGLTNGAAVTAAAHPSTRTNLTNNVLAMNAEDSAVILYNEDANSPASGTSPVGDYVYRLDDNRQSESRISFNNTWGPTLSDGDDYSLLGLRNTTNLGVNDDFEGTPHALIDNVLNSGLGNSIAEVEEAIRVAGQNYTSIYVDGSWLNSLSKKATPSSVALKSYYITHFPTKFFHFERAPATSDFSVYLKDAVERMLASAKPVDIQIWDMFEGIPGGSGCVTSPCITSTRSTVLGHELNFLSIGFFKNAFTQTATRDKNDNRTDSDKFIAGRVVLSPSAAANANNPLNSAGYSVSWPMLSYTFEATSDFGKLGQWRSMQRY